jgi:hypothetical protein
MFEQMIILKVKAAEERIHRFECPPNSPLGEIHDALCAMKAYVLKQMNECADTAQDSKTDEGTNDEKSGIPNETE